MEKRFSIEKLEERIAPCAGAIGLAVAAEHIPESVALPDTPCPDGMPELPELPR